MEEKKKISSFFISILIYCIRRQGMENDFKINVYFNDEGEEIENLLACYLRNLLENKIA